MDDQKTHTIIVWDLATRLFHWTLVVAFLVAIFSAFQDKFDGYDVIHQRAGILILILVIFRLFWGVFGSETARFTTFVKSPKTLLAYLRGDRPEKIGHAGVGHNPLGALSVILMLILLGVQAILGLFSTDAMLFEGPLAYLVPDAEGLTFYHRWIGYILIGLVGLHIAAIVFYKLVKKQALLLAMITGRMRSPQPEPRQRPQLLALVLFILAGAIVCLTIFIWLG